MIRVGFVRFFVTVALKPENGGKTAIVLALTPQGKSYKALVKEWRGLESIEVEKVVPVSTLMVKRVEYTYELKPAHIARYTKELIGELAATTVGHCINTGIVDYEDFTKNAAIYLVETALFNAVRENKSDADIEQVEVIDLVTDMQAMRLEREHARLEAQRIQQEAFRQHQADQLVAQAEQIKKAEGAIKTSFDLLFEYLTPEETKEINSTGKVTIKNLMGEFVVPVSAHGLVRQYVNGKYVSSYCIVFRDYMLPVGDEILMKVALLKADPQHFFKTANKFHEYHFR